ncbi:vignain-like protein [Tanacetum coccineum]
MLIRSKIHHHRSLQGDRIGNKTFMYANVQSVPTSVDWRKKGVVSFVKDQGQRGDSYDIDNIIVIVTVIYDKLMYITMLTFARVEWWNVHNLGILEIRYCALLAHRVKVIRILAGQMIGFAAMAADDRRGQRAVDDIGSSRAPVPSESLLHLLNLIYASVAAAVEVQDASGREHQNLYIHTLR